MARANIPTILPLDTYAEVLNINPLHFNQAVPSNSSMQMQHAQQTMWYQHNWQVGQLISRGWLAEKIRDAERDITELLGYSPAPVWHSQEEHTFPRFHRREYFSIGADIRVQMKAIRTNYGKIVGVGRRETDGPETAEEGVELLYTDPNTDGYYTLATITVPMTITEASEVKLYFAGRNAAPEWEIRPLRTVTFSGTDVIIEVDAWKLFDPDLWEDFPTGEPLTIDPVDTDNYVDFVDVYRVYNDDTKNSAHFMWERNISDMAEYTQDGRATIRDAGQGILATIPATYSDGEWSGACRWERGREPDRVQLWYQAGLQSEDFLAGRTHNPLSREMAYIIAILATARLDHYFHANDNVHVFLDGLMRDITENLDKSSFFTDPTILVNPFGTRYGEVMAWQRLAKLRQRRPQVGAVA